jgi:hypothetical protein
MFDGDADIFCIFSVVVISALFYLKYANKDIECVIPLVVTFLRYLTSVAAVCGARNVILSIWNDGRQRSDG